MGHAGLLKAKPIGESPVRRPGLLILLVVSALALGCRGRHWTARGADASQQPFIPSARLTVYHRSDCRWRQVYSSTRGCGVCDEALSVPGPLSGRCGNIRRRHEAECLVKVVRHQDRHSEKTTTAVAFSQSLDLKLDL